MASNWSYKNKFQVTRVNFNEILIKGEEIKFELSKVKLPEQKWLKSGIKSKGNMTSFEFCGEFTFFRVQVIEALL